MDLADKKVLITAANRGIGRALLDEALRPDAKRVYAPTRGPLQHPDKRVTSVTLDVTDAAQIQRAAPEVDSLDVLINNAGIAISDDLSSFEVIEQHLAVNLFGILNVTRAYLPMLKHSQGAIVNNLSMVALAPLPIMPSYSISKAAAFSNDAVTPGAPGGPGRNRPWRRPRSRGHGHEPQVQHTEGLTRVRSARHLQWVGK